VVGLTREERRAVLAALDRAPVELHELREQLRADETCGSPAPRDRATADPVVCETGAGGTSRAGGREAGGKTVRGGRVGGVAPSPETRTVEHDVGPPGSRPCCIWRIPGRRGRRGTSYGGSQPGRSGNRVFTATRAWIVCADRPADIGRFGRRHRGGRPAEASARYGVQIAAQPALPTPRG
jgi:hypothetical protein